MSVSRTARLLEATAPDAFASVLPEIDRCDRLSTAWDDMAEALSARDYNAFDSAKVRFTDTAREQG
jgi:hypothetical protein